MTLMVVPWLTAPRPKESKFKVAPFSLEHNILVKQVGVE